MISGKKIGLSKPHQSSYMHILGGIAYFSLIFDHFLIIVCYALFYFLQRNVRYFPFNFIELISSCLVCDSFVGP